MGNLCYRDNRFKEEVEVSDMLDAHLDVQREEERTLVKLLLLGAGESGKTTLFKQMRINYAKEDTERRAKLLEEEKEKIVQAFYKSFKDLLKAMMDSHSTLGNSDLDEMSESLYAGKKSPRRALDAKVAEFVKDVWNSDPAKEIWKHKNKFQITDSLEYFCEDIDRLAEPGYTPTEEDYLRCRITTTGHNEQTFSYNNVKMYVIDVGGQKSERLKWVSFFSEVTAVLFVASISEFDQKLFEDNNVDRITESVGLFKKTINYRVFKETPIMLFLNKEDLFREKLERVKRNKEDLNQYFPELGLGTNYTDVEDKLKEHLENRFKNGETNPDRIFVHYTTALDKDKFKTVFSAMAQIILTNALNTHFNA